MGRHAEDKRHLKARDTTRQNGLVTGNDGEEESDVDITHSFSTSDSTESGCSPSESRKVRGDCGISGSSRKYGGTGTAGVGKGGFPDKEASNGRHILRSDESLNRYANVFSSARTFIGFLVDSLQYRFGGNWFRCTEALPQWYRELAWRIGLLLKLLAQTCWTIAKHIWRLLVFLAQKFWATTLSTKIVIVLGSSLVLLTGIYSITEGNSRETERLVPVISPPTAHPAGAPQRPSSTGTTISPTINTSLDSGDGADTKRPTNFPSRMPTTVSPVSQEPTQPPTRLPSLIPTKSPTSIPTQLPTTSPTSVPTPIPTQLPTTPPTSVPSLAPHSNTPTSSPSDSLVYSPSRFPVNSPSRFPVSPGPTFTPSRSPVTALPTPLPSFRPSPLPSSRPTRLPPTPSPVEFEVDETGAPIADQVTFRPGNLVISENGLLLSQGLTSRVLARTGQRVPYIRGGSSSVNFHRLPDGAACFQDPRTLQNPGGWIYVSNSEDRNRTKGGVGAVTFNANGEVTDYRMVLSGTTSNCAGGRTPWETWISCEEYSDGRIWEVDPTGRRSPRTITLGGPGNGEPGLYESFAYDIRNPSRADFFVTEDAERGPLRKFSVFAPEWADPFNILHGSGHTQYLILHPEDTSNFTGTYSWTTNLANARQNAFLYYRHAEGIDVHGSDLFFISKTLRSIFVLDLDGNRYERQRIHHDLFQGTPDQIVRVLGEQDPSKLLYFTEDTNDNKNAGVHARSIRGDFFTILEAPDIFKETTGLAFSPDSTRMYVAWQSGMLFEIRREDGFPFSAETLSVQYHNTG